MEHMASHLGRVEAAGTMGIALVVLARQYAACRLVLARAKVKPNALVASAEQDPELEVSEHASADSAQDEGYAQRY